MEIVYQDRRIVVAVKPSGVLSTDEPGGAPELLRAQLGTECIRTVHRLDAQVAGLMVFARSARAASILSEQVRERRFGKEYLAVVHGALPAEGRMQDFLLRDRCDGLTRVAEAGTPGAKEARLSYRVLARIDDKTLVRVALETGRTHQIRVHMASIGHPIIGDPVYGLKKDRFSDIGGQCLHAAELTLTHPKTGGRMTFSAALPDYFVEILQKLERMQ